MHGVKDGRRWFLKPVDLFKSLVKTLLLQKQNFILVTALYNPSTRCTDSGIVHLRKNEQGKDKQSFFQTKAYVYPNRLS